MICGNDPRVRLTPGDREAIERFKEMLAIKRPPLTEVPCPGTDCEDPTCTDTRHDEVTHG